jgi:hypothetical protein
MADANLRRIAEALIMRFKNLFLVASSCTLLGACASSPAPTRQLADSQAAVRVASELGSTDVPEAALHVQMAKDRIARAESLSRKGDNDDATRLLEEAKADADLAVALTREQLAENEAQAAQRQLQSAPKPTQ